MAKKMSNIEISVYITNYNYGNFLEGAIQSLLKQTFKKFEIIVIDDGSTDKSQLVINKYLLLKDKKIRLIQHKNIGLIKSSNIAIRASLGKFIMRLDADDYLKTNALEKFYKNINKDPEIAWFIPQEYKEIKSFIELEKPFP